MVVLFMIIAFLILVTLGSYYVYKSKLYNMLFVARVNGTFITRAQLNKDLTDKYGKTALDQIITLTLAKDELKKQKIEVTKDEINSRVAEIEKGLNGTTLEDALTSQGLTRAAFEDQLILQVGAEKLLKSRISVADTEVQEFLKNYGSQLPGGTDEEKKQTALKYLGDQKLNEEISKWVQDLKTKATIQSYL